MERSAPLTTLDTPSPYTTGSDAPAGSRSERLDALDILRGLALFGMLLVHFHQRTRTEATGVEDLIGWVVYVGVEQKAWGTFAFLFGVGFAVLLRRLEARGAAVVPFYLRRLAVLAVFGIISEVFFGFHILFAYACWGVVLLVIRKWPTDVLLASAAIAAAARPVAAALSALVASMTPANAGAATTNDLGAAVRAAAEGSSYWTLVQARVAEFVAGLHPGWLGLLPDVNLALFIIGLLAVRHGVLDHPRRHVRLIVGWMLYGLLAWATAWLVLSRIPELSVPRLTWTLRYGMGLVQDQWLCFTYIGAVLLLLAYRPAWTRRLALFGAAGRMALTNYMMQAVLFDYLASGYGLGLRLRPYFYASAALLLFGVVALASQWWLRHYRFGPLEWLWRSLTYGRMQPMRLAPTGRTAVATP